MPLLHRCPACQALLRASEELQGKQVRCAKCGHVSLAENAPPPQQPRRPEQGRPEPAPSSPEPDWSCRATRRDDLSLKDEEAARDRAAAKRRRRSSDDEEDDRDRPSKKRKGRSSTSFDFVCPRCGGSITRGSSVGAAVAGGLVGSLLFSAFSSFQCERCGPIPRSEFPRGTRTLMTQGTVLLAGAAAVILVTLFIVLALSNNRPVKPKDRTVGIVPPQDWNPEAPPPAPPPVRPPPLGLERGLNGGKDAANRDNRFFDKKDPPKEKGPEIKEEPPQKLPPFKEEVNPFRKGTQTKLRQLDTLKAPASAEQLAYSPRHQLLFLRNAGGGIWAVDVKANKALEMQTAQHQFTDMSLAPDETALFAADYGGTNIGRGTPRQPSFVHRYDLAQRKWQQRQAPKIAYRVESVDGWRFLLLEQDQFVSASLNRWEPAENTVAELDRTDSDRRGDIEYDPRTGRIYHGNSGSTSHEINVCRLNGNKLEQSGGTGTYGTAQEGGGSAVLSSDGDCFYYGALQVDALHIKSNLRRLPEIIFAASRDLAFGKAGYYHAHKGMKIGDLGFQTAVYAISRDGMTLCAFNPSTTMLHLYAIEGEK